MQEWYYVIGGQQQGPVNLETLRNMAAAGQLKPDDVVWNATMADWVPSSQVDGIHSGSPAPSMAPGSVGPPPLIKNWADDPNLKEIEPGSDPLQITRICSLTLELTKKHFPILILMGLVMMGVSTMFNMIMQIVFSVAGFTFEPTPSQVEAMEESQNFDEFMEQFLAILNITPTLITILVVAILLSSVIKLYLKLGLTRGCLELVSGKEAVVTMIFGEAKKLIKAIAATILCALIVSIGTMLFLLPGIYFALKLSATIPAIVDRNLGVMEAMGYSFRITTGNCFAIFVLWLIAAVLGGLAVLFTCGLGVMIVGPVGTLGWMLCYRWMQYGSRVAE